MKLFTGIKKLSGTYYGQVKELWGTSTLGWVDGVLQKPTQEEINTAILNAQANDNSIKPKRTRKPKAKVEG